MVFISLMRHYIGRLADHIRAPKQLIEDSKELNRLLDNHEVCPIGSSLAVPPPIRDSHTNLRGILNRMPINAEEKAILKDGLLHLNKTVGIFDTFLFQYSIPTLEVHAEVQVLEYFYKTQRSFAGDDRFIACSKPACLCCEMYFRYHPAHMAVPSSHRKIWTKWSPPLVEQYGDNNPAARQQKHVLNKMTQDLCQQVLSHVLQHCPSSRWHPDSITNITDLQSCVISSDSLEVSDEETPETTPSRFSQEHKIKPNSPTEEEQISSDAEVGFQVLDLENGGVSLLDYTIGSSYTH